MPELTINVPIYCARCGAGLCNNTTERDRGYLNRDDPGFDVKPCEACLEKAKDEGDDEGYERGWAEAEAESSKGE